MGDGDRRRRGQAVGVAGAPASAPSSSRVEPARILDLAAVDDDCFRQRLGVAADHQRARERPRLRLAKYLTRPQRMPTSSSTSRRTASSIVSPGSAKAGQRRPHGRRKARRTAEHAALARDHQHDDDRIGARKMLGLAGRAVAPPAGLHHARRRAAIRTEAMARMPADQRLGFGERRQMRGVDQALHRDGAQVGDFQIVARLERLDRGRIEAEAETRRLADKSEEDRSRARAERAGFGRREQRIDGLAAAVSSPPVRRR